LGKRCRPLLAIEQHMVANGLAITLCDSCSAAFSSSVVSVRPVRSPKGRSTVCGTRCLVCSQEQLAEKIRAAANAARNGERITGVDAGLETSVDDCSREYQSQLSQRGMEACHGCFTLVFCTGAQAFWMNRKPPTALRQSRSAPRPKASGSNVAATAAGCCRISPWPRDGRRPPRAASARRLRRSRRGRQSLGSRSAAAVHRKSTKARDSGTAPTCGSNRRCAGQHGPTAGQSAEHDVEPGAALEPDRIDDGVEEGAEEGE